MIAWVRRVRRFGSGRPFLACDSQGSDLAASVCVQSFISPGEWFVCVCVVYAFRKLLETFRNF